MSFPDPIVGLVVSYSYLWANESERGQEEGLKNRPCAIVLVREQVEGMPLVTVAPITHTQPSDLKSALEVPPKVKQHLGLDSERSWVIAAEVNSFIWPGPDLVPIGEGKYDFGVLPPAFFNQIKQRIAALAAERKAKVVKRTE